MGSSVEVFFWFVFCGMPLGSLVSLRHVAFWFLR
jgi:hypothetical protein